MIRTILLYGVALGVGALALEALHEFLWAGGWPGEIGVAAQHGMQHIFQRLAVGAQVGGTVAGHQEIQHHAMQPGVARDEGGGKGVFGDDGETAILEHGQRLR